MRLSPTGLRRPLHCARRHRRLPSIILARCATSRSPSLSPRESRSVKLKLVGHASLLATLGDVRVLSDPWWVGPCFGAQWWLYPPADVPSVESVKIDYVYVSHGHHDHFHPATLKSPPRTFRVLVSARSQGHGQLRELGFEVVEVQPDKPFELAPGCTCSIWPTYADDTLMIMSDGREVCVNANDALHSAPIDVRARFVDRILAGFRHVDTFFCGYGTASHFPNCYSIPGKMARETAAARQHAFNENWADLRPQAQAELRVSVRRGCRPARERPAGDQRSGAQQRKTHIGLRGGSIETRR